MRREPIKKIQQVVLALSEDDFRELYKWMAELDHQKWDKQIEEDSDSGLLDDLANQAIADYKKGLSERL